MRSNRSLSIYTFILALTFLSTPSLFAQSSLKDLNQYLQEIRTNPTRSLPNSVLEDEKNESKLLKAIIPYLSDSLDKVRGKAYDVTRRIGQKSNVATARQLAVTNLVKGIKDRNTGISGSASEALTGFKREDFEAAARDSIGSLIRPQTPHLDVVIKLAGYLMLDKYKDKITFIQNSNVAFKIKWSCRLALARMNDQEAIQYINGKLTKAKVDDNFIYDVMLDLIYTRNKEIFNYLITIIQSDELKCESSNPDSGEKILCAYKVMERLAPFIEGSPLHVDKAGELQEKDFKTALTQLRSWLLVNKDFKINDSKF